MRYMAIAIAGFLGADLRYAVSDWIGMPHGFPAATLLINLAGCGFLGWFYTVTIHKWNIHPDIRVAVGTGLVGAFTTFSSFTVELWKLLDVGLFGTAGVYAALSLIGGLICVGIGATMGEQQRGALS